MMKKIFKTACLSLSFFCLLGIGARLEAGTFAVPPCAFMPLDYQKCTLTPWYAYPWELYVGGPVAYDAAFVAPLNLPNGVTIKKITIYFTDERDVEFQEVIFWFKRVKLSTGVQEDIASGNTDELASAAGRRSIVLTGSRLHNKTVNNNAYAYSIMLVFPAGCDSYVRLHEIAITY
jgi:hypothetical protein